MQTTNWKYVIAGLLLVVCGMANAQSFPTKPIKILVPYPPSGTTDLMARSLLATMSKVLGQSVIVDNRVGGGGIVAMREAARAAPDGYTIVFTNNGAGAIQPLLQKDAGYDPVLDFSPITLTSLTSLFLVAHPSVPANNVRELIDWAKTQQQGVDAANTGLIAFGHLATESFARRAGLKLVHVPYKGMGPAQVALLTGEAKIMLNAMTDTMVGQIKTGKLKLLGVSSAERSSLFPDAPPIAEVLPGFVINGWFGMSAPAKTPADIVKKLNEAIVAALHEPENVKRFQAFGYEVNSSTPERFAQVVADDVKYWTQVVKETGIRLD